MVLEHIVIFKNAYTQYDVLDYFTQSIASAFKKQGVTTTLVDFSTTSRADFMRSLYGNPPDCTLGFNGPHPLENGFFLASELEIPHIAWLVDGAHYFADMIPCPYHIFIASDQTSSDLLQKWKAAHSEFLPHAFEASLKTDPLNERLYPISFCGSLIDYLEIEERWQSQWPPHVVRALLEAADRTLVENSLSYQEAFETSVLPLIVEASEEMKGELVTDLDQYLRGKDRIELLKALEGLPVHIFGSNASKRSWSDFLKIKSYVLHEPLSFPQIHEVMRNSQVILNSSPMFKTGAHERIMYGLGLGAAVVTNNTPWINAHFSVGEEILTYQPGQWSKAHLILKELLEDKPRQQKLAILGQAKILKEHTWDVRVSQLLPIATKAIEQICS